jgi:hypothetical protein
MKNFFKIFNLVMSIANIALFMTDLKLGIGQIAIPNLLVGILGITVHVLVYEKE